MISPVNMAAQQQQLQHPQVNNSLAGSAQGYNPYSAGQAVSPALQQQPGGGV